MFKCLQEKTPNSSFITAADSLKGFPVTPLPTLPLPVIKLVCVINNTTVCDSDSLISALRGTEAFWPFPLWDHMPGTEAATP